MSWISVSTFRHEFSARYENLRADPEYGEGPGSFNECADILDPLICNFRDGWIFEAKRARTFVEKHIDGKAEPVEMVFRKALTVVFAATLDGYDPTNFLTSIVKSRKYKQPLDVALQNIAKRILQPEASPRRRLDISGSPENSRIWAKILEKAPEDQGFDLAMIVDSPLWFSDLRYAIIPLAYLLAQTAGSKDIAEAVSRSIFHGTAKPAPDRKILYERVLPRSRVNKTTGARDNFFWNGFDTIELCGNRVIVHYYLGSDWVGPLLFRPDMNLFWFLDHLQSDWARCEKLFDAPTRDIVARHKQGKQVRYHITYDARECQVVEPDLSEAAQHYGIDLSTADVAEVI